MSAPAMAASVIPTVAVRNECSATLSGLWRPSSCQPERGWFFSWPMKIGRSRRVRSADLADYVARLDCDHHRIPA
jgi:hypothetical protein